MFRLRKVSLNLEVSLLYHLDPEAAPEVYKTVGAIYEEIILVPPVSFGYPDCHLKL